MDPQKHSYYLLTLIHSFIKIHGKKNQIYVGILMENKKITFQTESRMVNSLCFYKQQAFL